MINLAYEIFIFIYLITSIIICSLEAGNWIKSNNKLDLKYKKVEKVIGILYNIIKHGNLSKKI